MTNIICDMCKKPIKDAMRRWSWSTRDQRYDTILDKDICPKCMNKLDDTVRDKMEKSPTYGFKEYRANAKSILLKSCK